MTTHKDNKRNHLQNDLRLLTEQEFLENIKRRRAEVPLKASVFYSSWAGGVTKSPELALVPVDDHMVHRGDAVFEAMRFGSGGIYLWKPHWNRLHASAEKLSLKVPHSEDHILSLLRLMVKESGLTEGLIRIYLARGTGSFSVSPYESVGEELYMVVSPLSLPPQVQYEKGVKVCLAGTLAKEGLWAQVKSCNYLVNVLAKKEALDRGFDYGITKTREGEITESSTENLLVLTQAGELLYPGWENTLKGTTLVRVIELAPTLTVAEKPLRVLQRPIMLRDLQEARALMLVGTTLGVLPVSTFESQVWTDFHCASVLHQALAEDIVQGCARKVSVAL